MNAHFLFVDFLFLQAMIVQGLQQLPVSIMVHHILLLHLESPADLTTADREINGIIKCALVLPDVDQFKAQFDTMRN